MLHCPDVVILTGELGNFKASAPIKIQPATMLGFAPIASC